MAWQKIKIATGRYRNSIELVGYQETDRYCQGKPLYPALPATRHLFGQVLDNLQRLHKAYPSVETGYRIFKLPRARLDCVSEKDYQIVNRLESLQTTLTTYILIPKSSLTRASIAYYYTPGRKKTLAEVINKPTPANPSGSVPSLRQNNAALHSNFGFYVTANLIGGAGAPHPVPWAHNNRYPARFHLPPTLYPFLGFHARRPAKQPLAKFTSTFQGFARALVGLRRNGPPAIIPRLSISSYTVYFNRQTQLKVKTIDPPGDPYSPNLSNSPILYTPNLTTPRIEDLRAKIEQSYWTDGSWQKFAPYVGTGRINLFIANKGNGLYPEACVIALWEGRCPLPAFGAVLSFSKEYFYRVFRSIATFKKKFMNKKVTIIPDFPDLPDSHNLPNYQLPITNYKTIYGSFAPLVLNRKYLFNCDKEKIMLRLRKYGNFTSPMEMLGQETKTIAPYVREPKNVLFETENYIGNILFSGRYELSIGASLIDMTHTTKILSQSSAFKEPIKHAIILDSGSAARVVFAYKGKLYPLNIVAPGARNKIGDPSGNFYSGLRIDI